MLEQVPKILKAVGVDATVEVLDSVINNFVCVTFSSTLTGEQCIGTVGRTRFDAFADLDCFACNGRSRYRAPPRTTCADYPSSSPRARGKAS